MQDEYTNHCPKHQFLLQLQVKFFPVIAIIVYTIPQNNIAPTSPSSQRVLTMKICIILKQTLLSTLKYLKVSICFKVRMIRVAEMVARSRDMEDDSHFIQQLERQEGKHITAVTYYKAFQTFQLVTSETLWHTCWKYEGGFGSIRKLFQKSNGNFLSWNELGAEHQRYVISYILKWHKIFISKHWIQIIVTVFINWLKRKNQECWKKMNACIHSHFTQYTEGTEAAFTFPSGANSNSF